MPSTSNGQDLQTSKTSFAEGQPWRMSTVYYGRLFSARNSDHTHTWKTSSAARMRSTPSRIWYCASVTCAPAALPPPPPADGPSASSAAALAAACSMYSGSSSCTGEVRRPKQGPI